MTQGKIPYFINPDTAPKLEPIPGVKMTVLTGLHGERMMMVLGTTLPGNTGPMHSHPHEQTGMVCAGKGLVRIGKEEKILQKGDFYSIPGNIPHGDTCMGEEPFVMLEIFSPVREDFIEELTKVSTAEESKEG